MFYYIRSALSYVSSFQAPRAELELEELPEEGSIPDPSYTELNEVLSSLFEIDAFGTFADKAQVKGLRDKAISLHKEFSENNLVKTDQDITDVQAIFSNIVTQSYELETKFEAEQKKQLHGKISLLIKRLEDNLNSEGLFLISGSKSVIDKTDVSKLDETMLKQINDINVVAALLQKILREMPEHLFDPIKRKLLTVDVNSGVEPLKQIIGTLSSEDQQILKTLIDFGYKVVVNESANEMTATRLAKFIVPNLITLSDAPLVDMMNSFQLNRAFADMIRYKDQIFN